MVAYPELSLIIGGCRKTQTASSSPVLDPGTGEVIGHVVVSQFEICHP